MGKENIIDIGKESVIENRYSTALYMFEKRLDKSKCSWLDIGVGNGIEISKISSNNISLTALDIEFANIKKVNNAIKRIQCDGCKIALPNSKYDVISTFEVLEHLKEKEQEQFISEIFRVLKPGGILFISTPNKEAHGNTPLCLSHKNELTPTEFQNLLEKQGFATENTYGQLFFEKNKPFHKLFMLLRQNKIAKHIYYKLISEQSRTCIKSNIIYPTFYKNELTQVKKIPNDKIPRIIIKVCVKPAPDKVH